MDWVVAEAILDFDRMYEFLVVSCYANCWRNIIQSRYGADNSDLVTEYFMGVLYCHQSAD